MLSTECHQTDAQCNDFIQTIEGPDYQKKSEGQMNLVQMETSKALFGYATVDTPSPDPK